MKKVYASEVAVLDSNVYTGGGTDDTAALQSVLDYAKEGDGVWLVMDGAALVSHLVLYSNTVIECPTKDCGFFQKAQSNCAIVTNANWNDYEIETKNISLLGGTYNQDCTNQEQFVPYHKPMCVEAITYKPKPIKYTFGIEFYGIENLLIRDVTIRNFRKFACTIGCFKNVTIENTWLDLPDHADNSNQDGFHFWGPGQFLTVKNVGGTVGDDFMNIGPDERDKISSITDVLVDGVFLNDADQAIRLLSRGTGRLDRVTLRNITGTYKSFGFFINPWFTDTCYGNFGNIFIENVDLKALKPNYDYRPPVLFSIGGNIEALTLKNIRSHESYDNRTLVEIGSPFGSPFGEGQRLYAEGQKLGTFVVQDMLVTETADDPVDTSYITVHEKVENLILKNITVLKDQSDNGTLVEFINRGEVKNLIATDIYTSGLKTVYSDESKIKKML